jgi:4-amino-4-deoxy-L-arabinose transferase-like glycosyltransferase
MLKFLSNSKHGYMDFIKEFWGKKPLLSILIVAFLARLVAVIFSQGYAFHDDHFLVVDAAQSWVSHYNWNDWMPKVQLETNPTQEPIPQGHSLLYPGIHYLILSTFEWLGIIDPKIKMLLIRLIHAVISLVVVFFSYKIANHYTNQKIAQKAALFIALMWFMPFMSVRNMVEVICIPFLVWGTWLLVKGEGQKHKTKLYFLAGLILGTAFSFRFQTLFYAGGVGMVILFRKQWKETLVFSLGVILSIAFFQGIIDIFIWKRPFAELTEYVKYNIQHRDEYGVNNYYMYFTLLIGMIIPPLGLYLFFGWFQTLKKYPLLFWPSFLFFLFHTLFPNKQERFIFPIITIYILAGTIGWWLYMEKSSFWQRNKKLFKGSMAFFWALNILALLVVSSTYSKRSRCEAMVFLGKQSDAKYIIVEESSRGGVTQMPTFYAGKDLVFYNIPTLAQSEYIPDSLINKKLLHHQVIPNVGYINKLNWPEPQYALFINQKDLENRVKDMKQYYPEMTQIAVINPSYIDLLMKKAVPSNNNQLIFVYRLLGPNN